MSRGRKQSREPLEASDIFSDTDFDAEEFVEQMDEKPQPRATSGSGWRRLEQLREQRMLERELSDFDQWDDFDGPDF